MRMLGRGLKTLRKFVHCSLCAVFASKAPTFIVVRGDCRQGTKASLLQLMA